MEAFRKSLRLLILQRKEQFPRTIRLFNPHMLDINLSGFIRQFDLYLAAFSTQPQENLFPIIQNHYIVIR